MKKKVIYTCITGGYDEVPEHEYLDPGFDYVCYTDNIPNKRSQTWEFRELEFTELDDVRNARWHKMHPHKLFPKHEESIWIDSNIVVTKKDFFTNIKTLSKKQYISVAKHIRTKNLWQEFRQNEVLGKDDRNLMAIQESVIRQTGFNGKYGNNHFFETNVILRKHNKKDCISLMNEWWGWIEKYSYRDQLSFTYLLWKNRITIEYLFDENLREASFIEFTSSKTHQNKNELKKIIEQNERIIKTLKQQNDGLAQRNSTLEQRADFLQLSLGEITSSLSWRITIPLRKAKAILRKIIP